MHVVPAFAGSALILAVLLDAFEAVILPRTVSRRLRFARFFHRATWSFWRAAGGLIRSGDRREHFLSFYGPLSLLALFVIWAAGLIVGFAALQWGLGLKMATASGAAGFGTMIYASGSTFLTLGIGDVTPATAGGRPITIIEAGVGFAFLAIVIGYVPVLYQSFSRREVQISLLDGIAGSPPSALAALQREGPAILDRVLAEWERWAADLLESHLSYPVLAYYRSQHDRQSWVAALACVLDLSALTLVGAGDIDRRLAKRCFAMSRHVAVDLAQIFTPSPVPPETQRLSDEDFTRLAEALVECDSPFADANTARSLLTTFRASYEPEINALSRHLLMPLPPWLPDPGTPDDWQTSAWESSAAH